MPTIVEVRDQHKFDYDKIKSYLANKIPEFASSEPISVKQFDHG
jgi:hypothetical protein